MKKRHIISFLFSILFFAVSSSLSAQNSIQIKGEVNHLLYNEQLIGAHIILSDKEKETVVKAMLTGESGNFNFSIDSTGLYKLEISYLGLQGFDTILDIQNYQQINLGQISLSPNLELGEIEIVAEVQPQVMRGDTTEFNAAAFKSDRDASAGDLIRKMPGIVIENGEVQAQGESVRRVLVDGEEFFGDDATIVLQNLPADMIERVQVYDRESDQSRFTGISDGNEEKTINIITRKDMSTGQFGRVFGGYGTDNHYIAGGTTNIFQGQRRISFIGLSNNINQQNFDSEDLTGVVSPQSQNQRGGRGGRGGRGRGGDSGNFRIGPTPGNSRIHSLGVNYTDRWGDNIKVSGSYFVNHTNNVNNRIINRDYLFGEGQGLIYDEVFNSESDNLNHRFNSRIEYTITERSSLIFSPGVSFQNLNSSSILQNSSMQNNELISESENLRSNQFNALNMNNSLLFRHRFEKERRTFSLNISQQFNNRSGEGTTDFYNIPEGDSDSLVILNQENTSFSRRQTYSFNFAYTEPITERSTLQFNYRPRFSLNNSEQETFNIETDETVALDSNLTNLYESVYESHLGGVNYSFNDSLWNFSVGMNYQWAQLKGEQRFPQLESVSQDFQSFLPSVRFRYRLSRNMNLNLNYSTQTNEPSVNQLQNVIDNSNTLLLSAGNPSLVQSYRHNVNLRFNRNMPETSRSFFVFMNFNKSQNFIGNETVFANADTIVDGDIFLPAGVQLSRPQNLDGQMSFRIFVNYSMPVKFLKSNFSINSGLQINRTPTLFNGNSFFTNRQTLSSGFSFSSNISQQLDFFVGYSAQYNLVDNNTPNALSNNYFSQNTRANIKWVSDSGLNLSAEVNHLFYNASAADFTNSYLLLNANIGYRFARNGAAEVKLGVFDILNSNNSYQRTASELYVQESQNSVLNRYFMLTFSYMFRNFSAA
ncbi:MAG: TonB-dependent receptor [Chitinophagaceae bacterium]|nr:MAG: TonB-dependent receptor [Chitinophagaceae bacterium]